MSWEDISFYYTAAAVVISIAVGYLSRPALGWLTLGGFLLTMAAIGLFSKLTKRPPANDN